MPPTSATGGSPSLRMSPRPGCMTSPRMSTGTRASPTTTDGTCKQLTPPWVRGSAEEHRRLVSVPPIAGRRTRTDPDELHVMPERALASRCRHLARRKVSALESRTSLERAGAPTFRPRTAPEGTARHQLRPAWSPLVQTRTVTADPGASRQPSRRPPGWGSVPPPLGRPPRRS